MCVGDVVTSIFAGLVIFSIIGYMSEELQLPIKEVASEGQLKVMTASKEDWNPPLGDFD